MQKVAVEFTGNANAIRKAKKDLGHLKGRLLLVSPNKIVMWRDKHDLWRKIKRDFKLDVQFIHWDK